MLAPETRMSSNTNNRTSPLHHGRRKHPSYWTMLSPEARTVIPEIEQAPSIMDEVLTPVIGQCYPLKNGQ